MHFVREWVFSFRVALQNYPEQTITGHYIVNELSALRRFDQQGRNHPGEDHNIGQAKDWQGLGQGS